MAESISNYLLALLNHITTTTTTHPTRSTNIMTTNNIYNINNNLTTPNTISTETFILGKGLSTTLNVLLLVVALVMSILVPTLYFYNIILKRNRKELDDQAIENEKTSQCGCHPTHHWKNFIFSLPMNSSNSLHLINDRGSFSLFQSTWFYIVIFRLASLCGCCGMGKKKKQHTGNRSSHDETEDRKMQRKHIRLYNISCWISSFWILLLRVCLLALAVVVAYYVGESETSRGRNWLTYTQYLTNNSFNVFVIYSLFITVSHIGFLVMTSILSCNARDDSLFPYLSVMPEWLIRIISLYGNVLWILTELNLVTGTVVSIGYWAILVPTGRPSATNITTLVNLTTHLFCWLASMIENFNSDFYLKFWHIFLVGIFCPCYLLFVIGLRESGFITTMPYGVILDYYQGTLSIFFHFLFILAYYVFFTIYWVVLTVIKKQLAVLLSDSTIKMVASKTYFMRHFGQELTSTNVHTEQNTAFDKL